MQKQAEYYIHLIIKKIQKNVDKSNLIIYINIYQDKIQIILDRLQFNFTFRYRYEYKRYN
jgi:hypothetical protein